MTYRITETWIIGSFLSRVGCLDGDLIDLDSLGLIPIKVLSPLDIGLEVVDYFVGLVSILDG